MLLERYLGTPVGGQLEDVLGSQGDLGMSILFIFFESPTSFIRLFLKRDKWVTDRGDAAAGR